jgi:hypothetical protein
MGLEIMLLGGSGSTVDGSPSGFHVIQGSYKLGRVSDILAPGNRAEAEDHEAGLGGNSVIGGLGSDGFDGSGIKNSGGGEMHTESASRVLGSVNGKETPGLDIL